MEYLGFTTIIVGYVGGRWILEAALAKLTVRVGVGETAGVGVGVNGAFSRKLENHCHMVALYTRWYKLREDTQDGRHDARDGSERHRSALGT